MTFCELNSMQDFTSKMIAAVSVWNTFKVICMALTREEVIEGLDVAFPGLCELHGVSDLQLLSFRSDHHPCKTNTRMGRCRDCECICLHSFCIEVCLLASNKSK